MKPSAVNKPPKIKPVSAETQWSQWKSETDKAVSERKKLVAQRTGEVKSKYGKHLNQCNIRKNGEISRLNGRTNSLRGELDKLRTELKSAGIFSFSKKKQLKAAIEEKLAEIEKLNGEKLDISDRYRAEEEKISNEQEAEICGLPRKAEKEIPLPRKPLQPMPRRMLAQAVLRYMCENRETVYSAEKLQQECELLAPCSIRVVREVLQSLAAAGDITCRAIREKMYYSTGYIDC